MKKTVCFLILYALTCSIAIAQGFLWAQGFSSNSLVEVTCVAVDANNVYAVGGFNGPVDFDQGPGIHSLTPVGKYNMFLLKEDSSGNFLWVKQFPNLATSFGNNSILGGKNITLDKAGNLYISGSFTDSFDFDPGAGTFIMTTPPGNSNAFILKLDSAGNFMWAKKLGGGVGSNSDISGLAVVQSNIYFSCTIGGTIDVDPGPAVQNVTTTGSGDILIEKLDTSGIFSWVRQIGGTAPDGVTGMAIDANGNILFTGQFQSIADFDPGPNATNLTSAGIDDIFIEKIDSAGNYQWAKRIGSAGSDIAQDIAVDSFGNVFVTGYYAAGTVDFDPGLGVYNITATSRDMFVLRLRNNGDFSWAISIHPGGNDDGRAITTDGQGNVYTTGEFFTPADFDPGPGVYTLNGGVYVQKLDSSGNFVWARNWGASIPACIGLDHSNNIYVTGDFNGPADFDPGPGVYILNGSNAGFIEKLCQSAPLVLSASSTTICAGDTTYLTAPFVAGGTYYWSMNGFPVATGGNTFPVMASGTYSVALYGSGCPSTSNSVTVTVTPVLHPAISLTGPSSANIGQQVTVNANVTNAGASYNINWKNNGVWFAATSVPSVTYTKQAGTDNITATILPLATCADSVTSAIKSISGIDGISEIMKAAGIEVYPNPFADIIIVKGLKQNDRLTLLDITGRIIQSWQVPKETETFKAEGLAAGHYILKIMNEKGEVRVNVPMVKQ